MDQTDAAAAGRGLQGLESALSSLRDDLVGLVDEVQTQWAWRPSAHAARMRSISSGRRSAAKAMVATGVRPGGSSSIAETSRSA